ncbi:unnamed protein product [Lepeophtheirus salmonis]|uniref:(salmon louse) hypothetical protein n=1 Tax=Lepeophtheirus salmonis TaxID=72036 RepID=A0A7R8CDN3_LEPSM|nr:unnamed protein product [Lepeophtheirus salmonis]CAF2750887.1 unnamed protein product [Lepeophtheirus salmonis]
MCKDLTANEMDYLSLILGISRNIRRWTPENKETPEIPSRRYGFKIPEEYQLTSSRYLFLQYESGIEDVHRIRIFSSTKGLEDLRKIKYWEGDGTFNLSHDCFYQVYTLYVQIHSLRIRDYLCYSPTKVRRLIIDCFVE